MPTHQDGFRQLADVTSVGILLGTIVGLLPAISAVFTLAYMCICIYETKTVQRWLGNEPKKRRRHHETDDGGRE